MRRPCAPASAPLITLDAFPDQRFPGFVRRVAPYVLEAEKQARTVGVEAEIENPEKYSLLPGYSADVEIIIENRENVLRIPTQAMLDGKRVLVLDPATGILHARDDRARRIELGVHRDPVRPQGR